MKKNIKMKLVVYALLTKKTKIETNLNMEDFPN